MTHRHNSIIDRHTWRRPRCEAAALAKLPTHRGCGQAAGIPLYLPLTGAVVVPYQQLAGGWDCVVLDDPGCATARGATARVTDLEIATALPVSWTVPTGTLSGEALITVWVGRIEARARGGHLPAVARAIAAEIRHTGTDSLTLDQATAMRVMTRAHITRPALQRLLNDLLRGRLLRLDQHDQSPPPTYHMRLPEQPDRDPVAHLPLDTRM